MNHLNEVPLEESPPSAHIIAPLTAFVVVAVSMLSAADSNTIWYVVRATGVVAYASLALSVVAGLLISQRLLTAGRPRLDLFEVHNFLSLLSIAFGSVHALALLFERYVGFSLVQILVPFTSSYRPLSVGLGVLSLYGVLVVYASFWARKLIGYLRWRALHYTTFAVFAGVTLHGFFSGADSQEAWMRAIYVLSIAVVTALTALRITTSRASRAARALTAAS